MKVKLIKGLSYFNLATGFSAKKDKFVDVEDELGAKLIATGKFAEVKGDEQPVAPAPEQAPTGAITTASFAKKKSLSEMKTAELEAYAKEKGIDISACKNNDERVAAIKAAEEAAQDPDGATPGFAE